MSTQEPVNKIRGNTSLDQSSLNRANFSESSNRHSILTTALSTLKDSRACLPERVNEVINLMENRAVLGNTAAMRKTICAAIVSEFFAAFEDSGIKPPEEIATSTTARSIEDLELTLSSCDNRHRVLFLRTNGFDDYRSFKSLLAVIKVT